MGICYNSTFLSFIMYLKYISIIIFIIFLIYSFIRKDNVYLKRVRNILLIFLIIFFSFMLLFNILNVKAKECFNNSNPYKLYYTSKLFNAYNSDNIYYSYDASGDKIKPTEEKSISGKDFKLKIYNINYYPISEINFSLDTSNNSYSMKDSGVEIATLATAISSLNSYTRDVTPLDVIEYIKYSENHEKNLDIDNLLSILNEENDFYYSEISAEQIDDAINRGGLVLAKVHGTEVGTIFTCSESYILIYDKDMADNYYIVNVNDKDYDILCDINSMSFGNVVIKNQNESTFSYDDITTNSDRYYVLWR